MGGGGRRLGQGLDFHNGGGRNFEVIVGGGVNADFVAGLFVADAIEFGTVGEGDVLGGMGERRECEEDRDRGENAPFCEGRIHLGKAYQRLRRALIRELRVIEVKSSELKHFSALDGDGGERLAFSS